MTYSVLIPYFARNKKHFETLERNVRNKNTKFNKITYGNQTKKNKKLY